MSAIANQCRLIPDRLEIDLGPGSAHVGQLFGVLEDGSQCLSDLINVKETHCKGRTTKVDRKQCSLQIKSTIKTHGLGGQSERQAQPLVPRRCFHSFPGRARVSFPSDPLNLVG